jgi:succinylarginine dihydrolase
MHLVVANLRSMPHRRIEANQTLRTLRAVFHDADRCSVHAALPCDGPFGDEGAANHTRLIAADGTGVHLFVFGARADGSGAHPTRHPARQTLEASMRVANDLHLPPQRCVFAQQSPAVIDAGVFHNDVIAVGSGSVLLFHAEAFLDRAGTLQALRDGVGAAFCPIEVHGDELTVAEAVSTYLFNSQLITLPDGPMLLVCPSEVREHARASAGCARKHAKRRRSGLPAPARSAGCGRTGERAPGLPAHAGTRDVAARVDRAALPG